MNRCRISCTLTFLCCFFLSSLHSIYWVDNLYQDCCCVVSSCELEIEGRALYLQPSSNNLSYAIEEITTPTLSPTFNVFDIDPKYHPGAAVSLLLLSIHNDGKLRFNWEYLRARDSDRTTIESPNRIGPFFDVEQPASYINAKGRNSFRFDSIDVTYGVSRDYCDCLQTHFFAGVSAINLRQTLTSEFSNTDDTIKRVIKTPTSFIGAGPAIGLDCYYCLFDCFYLKGSTTVSLHTGTLKSKTQFSSTSPILTILGQANPNIQDVNTHRKNETVPGFKGSIALGISSCFYCVDIDFEAGYQAEIYYNAIQTIDVSSTVITPPISPNTIGVYPRTFEKNLNNFAMAGPYISLGLRY